MPYRLYDIAPVLKPYVEVICSIERDVPMCSSERLRVLPDTRVELFVNFCNPQRVTSSSGIMTPPGRSFITARLNQFMDVQTQGNIGFVSVCFLGGSAYPFFPVPMHDMANQIIDLRDLWGPYAHDMQARVDEAKTTVQRVHIIQQYLIAQLRKSGRPDAGRAADAVDFSIGQIRRANGQLSLEEVARRMGISNRQLVRRFNERIGLSPKEFARMTTFLNALKHLKNYPALSLTEIAYEGGYYDQAHFIHACRDYSGLTPGQLLTTANVLY